MRVGQRVSDTRVFSQDDFDRFAVLSGDDNPIHVDPEFAARTRFGRPVAHGMLLYGAVCAILGDRLPGPGTVQLEQDLMFPSPTYTAEDVTIGLEVTDVRPGKRTAQIATSVAKPDGSIGLQGTALVSLPPTTGLRQSAKYQSPQFEPSESDSISHKGMHVGQRARSRRAFSIRDLEEYADLTGDKNPVIIDPSYARGLGLRGSIIPGTLLGGMFSYLLGTELPGRGTNYLKQQLRFPAFALPDQELTASVEIVRIRPEKQLVNLRTTVIEPSGDVVCRGEALVLVRDLEPTGERG
jgi:acyl dehydratase